jgi:hypothetical protein
MPQAGGQRSSWWSYVLVALLSFACSEIALRVYNRIQPSFVFYNSSYNRYRGNPFESWFDTRLNSRGFLDTEFGPKQPGRHRIIAIGDSFGHGVVPYRYNFLTLAEAELQKVRPDVELYNLGIPRIGPREYLSLLINEGLAYEPDTVLVSFFVGNDFRDAMRDYQQRALYEHSYVLSLLRHLVYVAPRSKGVDLPLDHDVYVDTAKSIDDEGYRRAKLQAAPLFEGSLDELRAQVAVSLRYLGEIQRVCASRGIKLLVALLPDELQVDEAVRREFLGEAGRDGAPLDLSRPNRMLRDALEAAGIPHRDLLEPMLDAARTTPLYKPNDTHWNIAGNALAAREIAAFLQSAL